MAPETSFEERYIACMVLHALGDTIGYKNSEWEFKAGPLNSRVVEKLSEFIDYGGVNGVPQKGWRVSDDTLMHVNTAEALVEEFLDMNELGNILKKRYIVVLKIFEKEGAEWRYPGVALVKYLTRLRDGGEWNDTPYDHYAGGSGASMRSSCIGLAFHGEKNRSKLIEYSIESSRMTHHSVNGYLGGMVAALFTAYAIEGIHIKEWPFLLMKLHKNGVISNYMNKSGRGVEEYVKEAHYFFSKWDRYIGEKFDDKGVVVRKRSQINLLHRTENYARQYSFENRIDDNSFPGAGGDDSVIISYDCLIDAGTSWEKLVVYSMLHGGDTDTTGSIAGSWWGALQGYLDVPMHVLDNLEFRDVIEEVGKGLYEKYGPS